MIPKTIYEVSEEDLKNAIRETITSEVEERIYSRFEGVIVNAGTACKILSISKDSLYKYVGEGEIQCEPRNGRSEYRFRLSEILRANIPEIRKKLRYLNY